MGKDKGEPRYILENLESDPVTGDPKNTALAKVTKSWMGHCLVGYPMIERHISLDFTGPPGGATGIYYSLMFQLGKWEFNVAKFDEWIEVSPVHAQYYQLTHKQKEDLEARIKSGLASAAQSVADLELLLHDLRKYDEMLRYLGYETKETDGEQQVDFSADSDEKTRKEREKRTDNHALRAIFIDQVDIHTGEGISIRSIVSRWPTLISDFQKLDDKDLEVDKVRKKLDISRAEAVILVTKNKLYQEWKRLFLPVVKERYSRIRGLIKMRESSTEQYKEWLKPLIARHKMIEEGLSSEGRRKGNVTSFVTGMGHAISSSEITIWTWKDYIPIEMQKIPTELVIKEQAKGKLTPYDDWTKRNLIFNKDQGLIVKYPWITEDWIKKQLFDFQNPQGGILPWMPKHKLYYSYSVIKFIRTNMRSATGEELEDGIFDVNFTILSQNAMLVKLLELKAKQEMFERYVNNLLGVPHKIEGKPWEDKKRGGLGPVNDFLSTFSMPMQFIKRGPYERDFDERITKYYLAPGAATRFVPIVNYIKQKMGYGQ